MQVEIYRINTLEEKKLKKLIHNAEFTCCYDDEVNFDAVYLSGVIQKGDYIMINGMNELVDVFYRESNGFPFGMEEVVDYE